MKIKINFWSFILSLGCIVLFIISTSSSNIIRLVVSLIKIHPLIIVLVLSLITFILGIIGLAEVKNSKLLLRSILSILISVIVITITSIILFFANWIPFT